MMVHGRRLLAMLTSYYTVSGKKFANIVLTLFVGLCSQ